jgi:hypothetical protein
MHRHRSDELRMQLTVKEAFRQRAQQAVCVSDYFSFLLVNKCEQFEPFWQPERHNNG